VSPKEERPVVGYAGNTMQRNQGRFLLEFSKKMLADGGSGNGLARRASNEKQNEMDNRKWLAVRGI
jgi:hypothetical protein